MEHPFVTDLSKLSVDDLQEKISSLTNKLTFSGRMNNHAMSHQLMMVLNSYQNEYNKRMDEMYKKQNIQNNIRISKENE
jgi:hypothetical protein